MSIRILLFAVLVTCFCGVAAAKPLTVSWPATADTPQSDRSQPFTSQQEQSEPLYLFTRRGVPPVTSLESAAGFVLGLLANSEAQQWLTEASPQQVVRVYPTVDALLQAHRSDACATSTHGLPSSCHLKRIASAICSGRDSCWGA